MSDTIAVKKSAVFSGGDGKDLLVTILTNRTAPLEEKDQQLQLSIGANGALPLKVGPADGAKIAISAEAEATLTPIWKSTSQLAARAEQLANVDAASFFNDASNADKVLLLLELGANIAGDLTVPMRYSGIDVAVDLKAGADSSYRYARAFAKNEAAEPLIEKFWTDFTVPQLLNRSLLPGERLVFEYGGTATLGLSASVGYTLTGSRGVSIGELDVAEKLDLGAVGKLSFTGNIAGRFNIEIVPQEGTWARVSISKNERRGFGIAAQLSVDANLDQTGFPTTSRAFLEGVFGVRVKSWFQQFQQLVAITDPATLQSRLDTLAQSFIEKYVGKAFAAISTDDVKAFFATIRSLEAKYNGLADSAVAIFDQYYDPIAKTVDAKAVAVLDQLVQLTHWDELRQRLLDPTTANILRLLGAGQILDLMQTADPQVLKDKAQKALNVIRDAAHEDIREFVAKVKASFGLDGLVQDLSQVDSLQKLEALTDKRLVGFAERIIGQTLQSANLQKALGDIHATLTAIENKVFANALYDKFVAALKQSFSLALNGAYNRNASGQALLTFDLDLGTEKGRELMRDAARGRFDQLLAIDDPSLRVVDGHLIRAVQQQTGVNINLVGWNGRQWTFSSMRELIVNTDQHVQPNDRGGLTATTTAQLQIGTSQKKNRESILTNLLVSFVGVTNATPATFDEETKRNLEKTKSYLVDAINGISASYALTINDDRTTLDNLEQYLELARDLQLSKDDPVKVAKRLIPVRGDSFGPVSMNYDVRYTQAGLESLFRTPIDEKAVRTLMRKLAFYQYVGLPQRQVVAWAYWTQSVADAFERDNNFHGEFRPDAFPAFTPTPETLRLEAEAQQLVRSLHLIENRMIKALTQLQKFVVGGGKLPDLQSAMKSFGGVLDEYGQLASTERVNNATFAIFDGLVMMGGVPNARASQLTINATTADNKAISGTLIS